MQAVIQILKLNEPRSGVKDGRAWEMQDAECLLLDDNGGIDQVGVLRIPKSLRESVKVGTFTGSFALQADRERRIVAVLTGLNPIPPKATVKAS